MMSPLSYLADVTDTDHDGSSIDNVIGGTLGLAGGVLGAGVGGLVGGVGGLVAGSMASAELGPGALLVGAATGAMGGVMGAGLGAGLGMAGSTFGEDVGDEISDLLGTRGPAPYGQDAVDDPYYANRPAGELSVGETINQWVAG